MFTSSSSTIMILAVRNSSDSSQRRILFCLRGRRGQVSAALAGDAPDWASTRLAPDESVGVGTALAACVTPGGCSSPGFE